MAFDLSVWKVQVRDLLVKGKKRLKSPVPGSLYGTIAATALWPVVVASQGGDAIAALMALGGVLAGVGGNLIADELEQWKNSAEKPEDIAESIAEKAQKSPEFRDEIDTVMVVVEALPAARNALTEKDQDWFVETLRGELERFGNASRFDALFGGIAVGRDVDNSVLVTGDNNSIVYIAKAYLSKSPSVRQQEDLLPQIGEYLKWMRDRYCWIELRGIKREGQQVVQLDLESVYVPLEAEALRTWEEREKSPAAEREPAHYPVALNQLLKEGNRLIITGGPGSGKTTTLVHLAHVLSEALLKDTPALAQEKLALTADVPLPIFVPLNRFATYLRQRQRAASARQKTLAAYITHHLIADQAGFRLPTDFFEKLLQKGTAVILLLDGLDEVPNEEERALVREAIEKLVDGRENLRVVVTCRSAAYKGRTALGKGFRELKVKPLDETHRNALILAAYNHLYRSDPRERQEKIGELINGISRLDEERRRRLGKRAERLVTSPLLVRMFIIVHFSERRLPEQRAELYMKACDNMLLPDYALDEAVASDLARQVGKSREGHREVVQKLAFIMHDRGEEQGREISETNLREALKKEQESQKNIDSLVTVTRLRGTLLEERQQMYRFIHLGFQEFLTARYLAEVKRGEGGIEAMVRFLEDGRLSESWWREPILLIAGYLSMTALQNARSFLERLAGIDEKAGERAGAPSPAVQLAAAELAGSAFLEWQPESETIQERLAVRIAELLKDEKIQRETEPTLRVNAGRVLANLEDPRSGVVSVENMEFCYVPPGAFYMGSSEGDKDTYDREKPIRLNKSSNHPYWISCYPVTNAQFEEFVAAGGYKQKTYWLEAETAGYWRKGKVKYWSDEKYYERPIDFDTPFNLPNHPVVGVTWYEALAFTRWLTKKWQEEGILSNKHIIRLPSESEWEKAARGGTEITEAALILRISETEAADVPVQLKKNPLPQRIYTWGKEANAILMNYSGANIGSTSAVGCFPGGKSPYGCEEMSGNVWEWCLSKWRDSYDKAEDNSVDATGDDRMVRGGSWAIGAQHCRVAFRGYGSPGHRDSSLGFRLVRTAK